MVVDAALADRVERLGDGAPVRRLTAALPGMPQQLEDPGLRKFRRDPDPAVELVDLAQEPLRDPVELLGRDRAATLRAAEALQCLTQGHDVFRNLLAVASIGGADRFEDLGKAGGCPTRRPPRGGEAAAQRPTPPC